MFDLEKAKAEHRVTEWYDHWRPAALDEIERLQAREQQLKLDVNRVHNETMTYKAAYGKQAACIQYLEDADGSNPPWEATEERIDGLLAIIGMLNTEVYDTAGPLFEEKNRLVRMLRGMLEEAEHGTKNRR